MFMYQFLEIQDRGLVIKVSSNSVIASAYISKSVAKVLGDSLRGQGVWTILKINLNKNENIKIHSPRILRY